MHRRLSLAIAVVVALVPEGASAQDVEMLGRRYGTTPPAAYFQEMARNPDAFRFQRGRAARMRNAAALRAVRAAGPAGAGAVGPATAGLGPRDGAVVGTIYVPVVLGLFSDSPPTPPVSQSQVQNGYFGPQTGTVTDYYREVSNDSITLVGEVQDWVRSSRTQAQSTEGISGLGCCGIGDYIRSLLDSLQGGVDWGAFDNDGPDGVPNSGDDDGYVDALGVIHPTPGAECTGEDPDRIWAHKWTLSDASSSRAPYPTTTPRSGFPGQVIQVDDYFVQGAVGCSGGGLNDIGVITHEVGHVFGLPDLYDTRSFGPHDGAGTWELMASGTWGCNGNTPYSPCHMGAWSKAMLGWVSVDTLPPDTDFGTLTLPPVESSGLVYRVDAADGSDEYFLLENRQSGLGTYDAALPAEGLLVWHVDQGLVDARWVGNAVNASSRMGVWLRQADGLDELGEPGGDRGDAGDPFPGSTGNTEFHAASVPSAVSEAGTATGLTVLDITPVGDAVDLRLTTRFTSVTLTASGTSGGGTGLFTVDGEAVPGPPDNVASAAPFVPLAIEAAGGEVVQEGERIAFVQWDDDPTLEPLRTLVTPLADTALTATYAGLEYELHVDMTGGVGRIDPGILTSEPPSPDLWFAPGTDVTITVAPQTGFEFLGWTGALQGEPNPASVTMDAPVLAGADFELIYEVPDTVVDLVATVDETIQLQVANGTSPVTWTVVSGAEPEGVVVGGDGTISGASLELGTFPLLLRATDALGLVGTASVTLAVDAPPIPIERLGNAFLLGTQPLAPLEVDLLDRQGNQNGAYDLGDLRAWILANPTLPLSADLGPRGGAPLAEPRVLTLPVRLQRPEGER